jgi:methylated-DNA-[protein]-cysteine S-methyltransferase
MTVCYSRLQTEIGVILIGYRDRQIIETSLDANEALFIRDLTERHDEPPEFQSLAPASVERTVKASIQGRHDLSGVDLSALSDFQRRVLEATAAIPLGELRTYGEVALSIGAAGAARAVGTALATNPVPIVVPCHRVVRANGDLGNYSGPGGPGSKKRLLEFEGAI